MSAFQPTEQPFPLGKVTATSGTPVRITFNFENPQISGTPAYGPSVQNDLYGNKIMISALVSNNGIVYVGTSRLNKGTLVGCLAQLKAGDTYTITNNVGLNKYRAGDFYIDVDNTGEGVISNVDTI